MLLNVPNAFSQKRLTAFELASGSLLSNMSWKTLVRLVDFRNKRARKAVEPLFIVGPRFSTRVKSYICGFEDFGLEPGVYLAGAFNHIGTGHAFVLRSTEKRVV